jgi:hypothetical protein
VIEGLIRFGIRNRVPVTLVMWSLVLGGVWSVLTMRREFFPEVDPDAAQVVLSYAGASPGEIEESLARKVEDAVREEDDVEKVTTSIVEGGGAVVIKFGDGIDIDEKLEDLRTRIDGLQDLPPEASTATSIRVRSRRHCGRSRTTCAPGAGWAEFWWQGCVTMSCVWMCATTSSCATALRSRASPMRSVRGCARCQAVPCDPPMAKPPSARAASRSARRR